MLDVDEVAQRTDPVGVGGLTAAVTATLVGFDGNGVPLVEMPGKPALAARSCVPLDSTDVSTPVVVVVDARNAQSPIVIGVIRSSAKKTVEIIADGQSVAMRAAESITLKCGAASITLSHDGKVVIRGKHVVSHASCVNRIRGGSVELN